MRNEDAEKELRLKGVPLSDGFAVARVCMFNHHRHSNLPMYRIAGSGVDREVGRVEQAFRMAGERLEGIRADVEKDLGKAEAEIFVAHRMILEDPGLKREVLGKVREEKINAESAVGRVLDGYENRLAALDDAYIKERATDIGEIKRRLLDVLRNMNPALQCRGGDFCQQGKNRIVVAEELTPTLTIEVDREHTMGFVTERGGMNSHAAILARAMGIPAVSGIPDIHDRLGCGTEVLINGSTGDVIVWPEEETIRLIREAQPSDQRLLKAVAPVGALKVMANVNMVSDVEEALKMGAEGIGLYRTEFEILVERRFLSEDELYQRYRAAADAMGEQPVVFRMFDIGSDKAAGFMDIPREENPSLGWRGTRLLLGRKDVMRTQARALGRVSEGRRIQVMYPMIVDVKQFVEVRRAFMEFVSDLPVGEISHGAMFEVPSACLRAREILREADFGSVGTNDLTQYLFAVDRDNDQVSYDYNSDREVFWDLIRTMREAAEAEGKPLSVCGELAGAPKYVRRLMDVGVKAVSVSPRRVSGARLAALAWRAGEEAAVSEQPTTNQEIPKGKE